MPTYLPPSLFARHLQPLIRFRPSFSSSRLQSARPVAHGQLCDEPEELGALHWVLSQRFRRPLCPHLHRMFKTQIARMNTSVASRLRHQQANHVIGKQVHPQLLLDHVWRQAAKHIDSQGGLEIAQVQLSGKGLARLPQQMPGPFPAPPHKNCS